MISFTDVIKDAEVIYMQGNLLMMSDKDNDNDKPDEVSGGAPFSSERAVMQLPS